MAAGLLSAAVVLLVVWILKPPKEERDSDKDGMLDGWEMEKIIDTNLDDDLKKVEDVLPGDDFDKDGLSNLVEHGMKSDPANRYDPEDKDRDGLPDVWEMQIVDHDPSDDLQTVKQVLPDDDFDKDEVSNLAEFKAGTDPCEREPHPLAGRKQILAADPGEWRQSWLSYTSGLPGQEYPIATVEGDDDDLVVWELVGVEGYRDVYKILCRQPGDWDGANLTYTKLKKQDFPLATVERNDPSQWKILPDQRPHREDCYTITLFDDNDYPGHRLSWDMETELVPDAAYPVATLEKRDTASWRIIDADADAPPPAKAVTHAIVFPRWKHHGRAPEKLLEWSDEVFDHIADKGSAIVRLKLQLEGRAKEDDVGYGGKEYDADLIKKLGADKVRDLLPGILLQKGAEAAREEAKARDIRSYPPFPLVIPMPADTAVEMIQTLELESRGFWGNATFEMVENFQARLDERPEADGRVFHGNFFTYVFVNLAEGE